MNTDGNTDAINRHLAEREEYDMHQSMIDDIEALRDEVEKLEAQRDELLEALIGLRKWMGPSGLDMEIDSAMNYADAVIANAKGQS